MTNLLSTGTFVFYKKENWLGLLHDRSYREFILLTYNRDRKNEVVEFYGFDEDDYLHPSWARTEEHKEGATLFEKFFVPPELV